MNTKSKLSKFIKVTMLGVLFAGGLMLTSEDSAFASKKNKTFKDVPKTHTFWNEINYLASEGVIDGYDNGTFNPQGHVTRGQTSKIIVNSTNRYELNYGVPRPMKDFKDVREGHWHKPFITKVYVNKIVDGYFDTFEPNTKITRAQASKFIVEAFKLENQGKKNNFKDVPKGVWYEDYVNILYSTGVTKGDSKGNFSPSNQLTRGQLSAFVVRAMEWNDNQAEDDTIFIPMPDRPSIPTVPEEDVVAPDKPTPPKDDDEVIVVPIPDKPTPPKEEDKPEIPEANIVEGRFSLEVVDLYNNKPIENVTINLVADNMDNISVNEFVRIRDGFETGLNGKGTIDKIPANNYTIQIKKPSGGFFLNLIEYKPNNTDGSKITFNKNNKDITVRIELERLYDIPNTTDGLTKENVALMQQDFLKHVNNERRKVGVGPVKLHKGLNDFAVYRSFSLAEHNYFGHEHPVTKQKINPLFNDMGYDHVVFLENLHKGRDSINAKRAYDSWFNSPGGHYYTMVNRFVEHVGLGVAQASDGTYYWTATFAKDLVKNNNYKQSNFPQMYN